MSVVLPDGISRQIRDQLFSMSIDLNFLPLST